MTDKEWFALIDKTLDQTEGAQAAVKLKDEITAALSEHAHLSSENERLKSDNAKLRDTNAQLAIRVTSVIPPSDPITPPSDKTPEENLNDLLLKIKESDN